MDRSQDTRKAPPMLHPDFSPMNIRSNEDEVELAYNAHFSPPPAPRELLDSSTMPPRKKARDAKGSGIVIMDL